MIFGRGFAFSRRGAPEFWLTARSRKRDRGDGAPQGAPSFARRRRRVRVKRDALALRRPIAAFAGGCSRGSRHQPRPRFL